MSDEIPVAIEGKTTADGRYVEPGALTLPIGAVPVTGPGPQGLATIIGRAVGFRRDNLDVIHATIDLFEGDLPEHYSPAVDIDRIETDGDTRITAGTIRMVHLLNGLGSMWPDLDRGEKKGP